MTETVTSPTKTDPERVGQPAKLITLIPPEYRSRKRWAIAQSRNTHGKQHLDNIETEERYHFILTCAKKYLIKQSYFERDYKKDNTQSAYMMHAFICKEFFMLLECDITYNYRIEFAFYKCAVRQKLLRLLQPLINEKKARVVELEPDFTTFFKGVFEFQDSKHLYSL